MRFVVVVVVVLCVCVCGYIPGVLAGVNVFM